MPLNKQVIERCMEGSRSGDHAMVLSCLADDIEWVIPGVFRITGKAAFDREIENQAFVGRPTITVSQYIEERDIVVAEGAVQACRRDGGELRLELCDAFTVTRGKVRRHVSYLVEVASRTSP